MNSTMETNIQGCLNKMQDIQSGFTEYIESEEQDDSNFRNILDKYQIYDDKHDLSLFFHFLANITNHYHRNPLFFDKIFNIFSFLRSSIHQYFSNREIFNIFKGNKRILLFFIEEKILIVDEYFASQMMKDKFFYKMFPHYFFPEIKQFLNNSDIERILEKMPENYEENFEEKRKENNDNEICKLIQNDQLDDFILFINTNNYPYKTAKIEPSIFETNYFLTDKNPSLIEYAAFFGSFQIFKYLFMNKVHLRPCIWLYVIHSNNGELIHLIEDQNIEPEDKTYKKCLNEAIKCHYNDIAQYIQDNFVRDSEENIRFSMFQSIKYYDFGSIQPQYINRSNLLFLCKTDYYYFIKFILNIEDDNDKIAEIILKIFFF